MYKIIILNGLLLCLMHHLNGQCTFTLSNTNICSAEELRLTVDNPDQQAVYGWDFNSDGIIDIESRDTMLSIESITADSVQEIVLYKDGSSCASQPINYNQSPDASIGVPAGVVILNGKEMKACNGSPVIELSLFNRSKTFSTNKNYTINWGDGSPAETFDNSSFSQNSVITHTYSRLGYFSLLITVESLQGCIYTDTYTFYNGGNPSVGLVNPGNTVGLCAPATLNFPITNTENNPPGTVYRILVSGVVVDSFTQDNVPAAFTYTFEENSCNARTTTGAYNNAFDVQIQASNPCNSSAATIEPIEVSSPPELDFGISSPPNLCVGAMLSFDNRSSNIFEILSGNPSSCLDVLSPNWTISGTAGEDWNVSSGSLFDSQNLEVEFLKPGAYQITMTVISFSCGEFDITKTINIFDPPQITLQDSIIRIDDISDGGTCAPFRTIMPALASGDSLSYHWEIFPENGWSFIDSTDQKTERPHILFSEGGDYMIRVEISNPCSSIFWEGRVAVPGKPDVVLAPIPDFCLNATLTFDSTTVRYKGNGSAISSTSWSFPGAAITSSAEAYPTAITYDSVGSYVVSLATENACGIQTVSDTFVIQQPGSLNIPNDLTVCSADPPILLEALPAGGTWTGPGVRNNYFYPQEAFPGRNSVTYNYGTGVCFAQATFVITVNRAPEVNAGADISVCQNTRPITLDDQSPNGNWLSPDNILSENNTVNPSTLAANDYLLIYELTDDQGCQARDSITLTIKEAPELTISDTTYCNTPGRVRLPIAFPAGGNWSGPGIVDPAGFFNPANAGGPGTYRATYALTAPNGCELQSSIQIGVIDPSAVNAGPDRSVCSSDSIILLNEQAMPGGGRWISTSPGLVGRNTFDPSLADNGPNILVYQVGRGNCRVRDSVIINVVRLNTVNAGRDLTICGDQNLLILNGAQPRGGRWSGPGITDPIKGHFSPLNLEVGAYELTYTVEDTTTGCFNMDTKKVRIRPAPKAQFAIPTIICKGSTLDIVDNSVSEDTDQIQWSSSDGRSFDEQNPSIAFNRIGTFEIDLLIETAFGCSDDFQQEVEVIAAPKAAFSLPQNEACEVLNVIPINNSQGRIENYTWDFGNGTSSNLNRIQEEVTFLSGINDTSYILNLVVSNQCGQDRFKDTVNVKATPKVDFGITLDTACSPYIAHFNNISQGNTTDFQWDFGNGLASTDSLPLPQPFEADTIPEEYLITLIGRNACGLDTIQKPLYIVPERVKSFFNTSILNGCSPLEVEFEDYSTPGTRISWDFGNGQTSNNSNPTQIFTNPGQYLVRQYASNPCAMDSSDILIEVLSSPEVDFDYSSNLCAGQTIKFANQSTDLTNATWFFGNGDSTTATNPSYTYHAAGDYNVLLRIQDLQTGCTNELNQLVSIGIPPTPIVSLSVQNGCTPLEVQFENTSQRASFYQWDFGDSNNSVSQNPVHTYLEPGTYEIKLILDNEIGCRVDTLLDIVHAFPVPTAKFETPDTNFCGLPQTIDFSNLSSGASGFEWTFDQQMQSTLNQPAQEFFDPGTYTIQLEAFNEFGCRDIYQSSIKLLELPTADFSLDFFEGCNPFTTSFQPTGNGNSFFWKFGDGQQSTDRTPEHTYEEAGFYDVELIIGNQDICFDTIRIPSAVEVWQTPTANFSWADEINGEPTGRILFTNASLNADQFFWDFGDQNTSEEKDPVHRYFSNSIWEVYLEAIAENGCTDDTLMLVEPRYFGKLYVPNAFAPLDGRNESKVFLPKGHGLKEYHLQIFSAYGELLWESFDLDEGQPMVGWDGTHNGIPLPQDVYVWKIRAVFENGLEWTGNKEISGKFQKMGSVTLLR